MCNICVQYLDFFFLFVGVETLFFSLVGLTGQERGYRLGECEVFGCTTTILVGAWTKKSRHKRGNGEVRGDRL